MGNFDNITVCVLKGGAADAAQALARKIGKEPEENLGDNLTVLFDKEGVKLCGYGMTYQGDFERMLTRITCGRINHELLVRAAKTKKENPTAIDCTAGMGEDAFLLAAAGYTVTLFEQDVIIAALLKDALRRAKKHPVLSEAAGRMKLIEGDSTELLKFQKKADLIYLDPMFPARKKSGLINKKLQLIQHLESPCAEEEKLLAAAFSAAPEKIIIKRPLKGGNLADKQPQYSLKGKAIRYDCFVL